MHLPHLWEVTTWSSQQLALQTPLQCSNSWDHFQPEELCAHSSLCWALRWGSWVLSSHLFYSSLSLTDLSSLPWCCSLALSLPAWRFNSEIKGTSGSVLLFLLCLSEHHKPITKIPSQRKQMLGLLCGHSHQQEWPEENNSILIGFFLFCFYFFFPPPPF